MTRPVVFWGATGQARVLRECLEHRGFELIALFDNSPDVAPPFADVPLYRGMAGFAAWRAGCPRPDVAFLAAIAGARGRDRLALHAALAGAGLTPVAAVHPTAFVAANAVIGEGAQILAQAAVCVDVRLGRCCIINTRASADHECRLDDGVHLAPGATLTGCVSVGAHTLIGANAVVLPRVTIGRDVLVGAGAVVTRDVPDGSIVYGNPARIHGRNPLAEE